MKRRLAPAFGYEPFAEPGAVRFFGRPAGSESLLLKLARKAACRISLGTDAHHPWQLEFIELGLAAALKAKIPADRIINFMSLGEVKHWARSISPTDEPQIVRAAAGCVSSSAVYSLESSPEASLSRSLHLCRKQLKKRACPIRRF